MNIRKVAIISAARTPVGKAGGALASVPAYKLGSLAISNAIKRAGINPGDVEQVFMGNVMNNDINNLARVAALDAGIPQTVPAVTLDIQCGSALAAIAYAAMVIQTGQADIMVAGGAESDSNRPYLLEQPKRAHQPMPPAFLPPLTTPPEMGNPTMGITAENIARKYGITRQECDEFAVESHHRAAHGWAKGYFKDQIVPIELRNKKSTIIVNRDETFRENSTLESLAELPPAFLPNGVVTAAGSSPMSDGAAAVVLMEESLTRNLGKKIMATIVDFALAGVDPALMGTGPIPAVTKLLQKTGIALDDIDLFELNEAFAAQSICCIRELKLNPAKVNVNGGALALGHPLGATGAILTTKMVYELERRDAKLGLIAFCVGGGQGAAMLIERNN